ncbi:hypothetical protein CE91St41_01460 [Oscillospiraceae bacterium]|nr:hypothetical protein CE91St40_01460 [Oscillospiraceae bacterium]BDF73257.1 hypothetical protein CE91St41_01460 [Oscillospiraceae bacterium]
MVKIGLLGSGKLGGIIARGLHEGRVPGCKLVGILDQDLAHAQALADETGGPRACSALPELLSLKPNFVLEAATADALKQYAADILSAPCNIICLSIGALSDGDFYRRAEQAALEHGSKLYLSSGVIGGFDLAATAAMVGPLDASITKHKYPTASPECPAGLRELPDRYEASVRDAFAMSPRHLNIGIAVGLACGGDLDRAKMKVDTVPTDTYMGFSLELEGAFGAAQLHVQQGGEDSVLSGPMLAGWSSLALLKRLTSPITF